MREFRLNLPEEREMQPLRSQHTTTNPQSTTISRTDFSQSEQWKRDSSFRCVSLILLSVIVLFFIGFVLFFNFRADEIKKYISKPSPPNFGSPQEHKPVSKLNQNLRNDSFILSQDATTIAGGLDRVLITGQVNDYEMVRLRNDCQTQVCRNYSQILAKHMNLDADPCQDFHEYVCGNWNKHFDNNTNTHWVKAMPKILVVMETALSEAGESNSRAVQYVIDLYRESLDDEARDRLGVRPLRHLLKQLFGHKQWPQPGPVLLQPSMYSTKSKISGDFLLFWNSNNSSSIREKLDYTEHYKFKNFWKSWMLWKSRKIETDSTDSESTDVEEWMDCYVEVSMIGFELSISIIGMDKKSLKLNANEITLLPMEDYEDVGGVYEKFKLLKGLISALFNLSDLFRYTSLDDAIYEVIDFYQAVSRISPAKSNKSDETVSRVNMMSITLGELKEKYSSSQFNWTVLLNKYAARTGASLRFTDKDTVRVETDQLAMFKPFTELLAKTPIRVLKNAMALQLIRVPTIIGLLDSMHRGLLESDDTLNLITLLFPGMMFVVRNLDEFAPIFVRLYADYVGRQKMIDTRDQVIEMMNNLKETFGESLKHDHTWLDEKTKQNALDKLEAIKIMIAFPDWIFDDAVLDENFGFSQQNGKDSQHFIKGQYAASFLNFRRLNVGAEFRKNDQVLEEDRVFRFFKGNAAYATEYNFIGVSYDLLTEPWFNMNYPSAINYGNLGYIIAHEIMHAFDDGGRLYDKHGEKVNWWTNSTSKYFDILTKCFVKQYDGLEEPITGVIINGTAKLSDNIADNGGLNQAYRAFENSLVYSRNTVFDVFPSFRVQLTSEQLFFVSYGINWCSNGQNSTEYAEFIQNDPHSPNKFRVNIPLSNMAQFAKSFNCPVGSPMNPKHKCSIW